MLIGGLNLPALAETSDNTQVIPTEKPSVPPMLLKPGQRLFVGTDTEDLVATYDVDLARKQVAAYPDSPEARFILAVALSRTSYVEEALKEVRTARHLAEAKGDPSYFDHMISVYEGLLTNYPEVNEVHYGLAWAYYMKAYLVNHYHQRQICGAKTPNQLEKVVLPDQRVTTSSSSQADAKPYYEAALKHLDILLSQDPSDIWARVYRAFLQAEYTGNLDEAINTWQNCKIMAPDNPASYFFLGEAYLKKGNLKECLNNIAQAVALRAIGK